MTQDLTKNALKYFCVIYTWLNTKTNMFGVVGHIKIRFKTVQADYYNQS